MIPETVIFLHVGGNQLRGSEESLLTLLSQLDRTRFNPIVVCPNQIMCAPLAKLGVECHIEVFPEILLTTDDLRFPLIGYYRALKRITDFAREKKADLIFCNGGGPCQIGVPLAERLGLRCVCYFHHPAPRLYHVSWLTGQVDKMIFASKATAEHTRERIGSIDGEVIYLGLNSEEFAPAAQRDPRLRNELGIGEDEIVFAQVGALVDYKGHDVLLDAFAFAQSQCESIRLLIIGTGPREQHIRRRIQKMKLGDRVMLTGFLGATLPYLQHAIDVHVLASMEEGLGNVNLHASSVELPNIGSDSTGIRETIKHGETGFLFEPGNAKELADCMVRLARDQKLRREMGTAGRRFVQKRFEPGTFIGRIQEILDSQILRSG